MTKLEALADAIVEYNGSKDPKSLFYKLRNPGRLKAFYPWQPQDENGNRAYSSLAHGYQSLIKDLEIKCSGQSRCGLVKESPFFELTRVMGFKDDTIRYITKFVSQALDSPEIREDTPINYFMED